ncbi:hypothetical protein KYI92_15105 [Pantoea allii]|uniref:Uncharacterized protein n=1 Tax=Pantoea allii TaxID=574096 RepID=A0ABS6VH05_9GAMM|nr:hypothetical protein [Pantoea allii]MBW1215024.1 hypothetical protein [Pantoea allii]MBW1258609.1 hypothetical protein [Pantoea allii]MBW1267830.1 hypothetical protein [Pantoea allii]MBW1289701.1 hypothetical protein [Pantoea allii]
MNHGFEQHVQYVFERAMNAVKSSAKLSNPCTVSPEDKSLRGHADIVVINPSERLASALKKCTQIVEVKPNIWVVGDFTRRDVNFSLSVNEAAVDCALKVLSEGIDGADGQFRAPSWIE